MTRLSFDMTEIILHHPEPPTGKLTTYAAKYNIEFFERKKIPSYGLWSVYIKIGHRYPKTPKGYGAAATLDDTLAALHKFLEGTGISKEYIRPDGTERWARIKQLIVLRDFAQVPLLANSDYVRDTRLIDRSMKNNAI
jgi:hypothetical protein